MKVLITGPDGFVGSNLVRELLSRGSYEIRGLMQPGREATTIDGLDVDLVEGDLLSPERVAEAASGCDAVIHTAASTAVWPRQSDTVYEINVSGTKCVIDACLRHGVSKLVHVGTANSFGPGSKAHPGDELTPYGADHYRLTYMSSKREAQRIVLQSVRERSLPALTVNPTFMFGPFDRKPGSGALILGVRNRKVSGYAPGGRNFISVKDVAAGIANALERGRIGESYILAHRNLSYQEIIGTIAEIIGVDAPRHTFPKAVVKTVGAGGSLIGLLTGREPALSYVAAKIACDEHYYTGAKAVNELALPQTPIETAIAEAFDWFVENGYAARTGETRSV